MQHHQFPELFVAQKQAELEREIKHNNLLRESKSTYTPLQTWANNKMHDFSVWMICTGEKMHKRYHRASHLHQLHPRSSQAR